MVQRDPQRRDSLQDLRLPEGCILLVPAASARILRAEENQRGKKEIEQIDQVHPEPSLYRYCFLLSIS